MLGRISMHPGAMQPMHQMHPNTKHTRPASALRVCLPRWAAAAHTPVVSKRQWSCYCQSCLCTLSLPLITAINNDEAVILTLIHRERLQALLHCIWCFICFMHLRYWVLFCCRRKAGIGADSGILVILCRVAPYCCFLCTDSWVERLHKGCAGKDTLVQCNFGVIFRVNLCCTLTNPRRSAAQPAERYFHGFSGHMKSYPKSHRHVWWPNPPHFIFLP